MKTKLSKSIILLTGILLLTGCGKDIEVKNGSKVAVSVKKEQFTATEYYEKIKEDNISTLVEMIDKSILEKNFKTDDEENKDVNKQLEQIKNYYGSNEDSYKNVLRQYFGVETEKELEEKLRLEYKRKKAVEDYIKRHLTDKEVEDYYNNNIYGEIKASHILITIDSEQGAEDEEEQDNAAKDKAKEIIKQLDNGEKFSKLAKTNSKDEATAINGGDLGYFDVDDMTEAFANAVKNLKVNEYTKEPIKTEYGYHIIIKTDEKEKPKLKDVEDKIREKLKDEKMKDNNTIYYETLKKVREENKITWNDTTLEDAYNKYMNELIENASK